MDCFCFWLGEWIAMCLLTCVADDDRWGPMSAELINYGLALIVYSVRYPAVFWYTNKAFGALFSIQLLANSFQCLILYAGMCILYKVCAFFLAQAFVPFLRSVFGCLPRAESLANRPWQATRITLV